jgi:hypothetical protein
MDKHSRALEFQTSDQGEAVAAAESVRTDFGQLLSMLNQHLASVADTEKLTQSHLLEAKAAAERGLALSMQLVEILRAAS